MQFACLNGNNQSLSLLYRLSYKFRKLSLMEFAKLIVIEKKNFEVNNYLL